MNKNDKSIGARKGEVLIGIQTRTDCYQREHLAR
jgi:hypothetical protein